MRLRGFTLIEVLVSLTVMMLLVGAATASFLQLRTMTRRIQARQGLNDSSRLIFDRLRTEFDSMHHAGAWWLRSSTTGTVEVVFLRSQVDMLDFMISNGTDTAVQPPDLRWLQLKWDKGLAKLTLSTSSPTRAFQLTNSWINPGVRDFKNAYFLFTPQPVRQAGSDPQTPLNANRLDSLNPMAASTIDPINDLGDYDDLQNNAVPLAINCTHFAIQAVLSDDTVVDASADTDFNLAGDGLPVDGRGTAWAKRPRLLRLNFTLQAPGSALDPATMKPYPETLIEQNFTYTFRTPSLLPGPTGP